MGSSIAVPTKQLEDALAYLPCSTVVQYRKGQIIYNQDQPSTGVHLVMEGMVKLSRLADGGHQVLVAVYQCDELFGEAALLLVPHCDEQATALEHTRLMSWTASQIEDIGTRRPRLMLALVQMLVQRTITFTERIESFCLDTIEERLARTLISLSERLGIEQEDGSVCLMAFTHELLGQYVGTARQIITQYMTRFRKAGYVSYSRRGITVYQDALRGRLRQSA